MRKSGPNLVSVHLFPLHQCYDALCHRKPATPGLYYSPALPNMLFRPTFANWADAKHMRVNYPDASCGLAGMHPHWGRKLGKKASS